MYILAIETTGIIASAALIETESGKILSKESRELMGHLKNLIPLISTLLNDAKVDKSKLSAVAASIGPGSYTGIRIGVSTARALALGLKIPCIKVPTLDSFRLVALASKKPVCVIFNARRGQVYSAVFDTEGKDILKPGPYMLAETMETVKAAGISPVIYGDGIDAYAEQDEYREMLVGYEFALEEERYQTAKLTALYAKSLAEKGKFCEVSELLPDYMRKTEAEQKLADGSLEKARKAKMAKFMSK